MKIKIFYPNYFNYKLITYVCTELGRYINNTQDIQIDIWGTCSDSSMDSFRFSRRNKSGIYHDLFSPNLWSLLNRVISVRYVKLIAEFFFLQKVNMGEIIYLWPGVSPKMYKKLKNKNCIVFTETINTMMENSKEILLKEFQRVGIEIDLPFSDEDLENEKIIMQLSDYIFSPSPSVSQSIARLGIGQEKILNTSFGMRATDILNPHSSEIKKRVTAIFVGRICIRKGVHLLLEAWEKVNPDADLILIGRIFPEVAELVDDYTSRRDDIRHIDYVDDLVPHYQNADFFVLPSLEEGSPLVTYLALGASLPVIVSPMGGGGLIEQGREGFIINPFNIGEFSDALKNMISDSSLRKSMANAAYDKSKDYTWENVAKKRAKIFRKIINGNTKEEFL